MRAKLTARQREVLHVIRSLCDDIGYAPTVREIADVLNISLNGVQCHLEALERKGALVRDKGKSRSIRLLGAGA